MREILYMQIDKNIQVYHPHVYLQDIAQLSCRNSKVLNRCRVMPVMTLEPGKTGRYVMTVTDLIEKIGQREENLEILAFGETTFIISYDEKKAPAKILQWFKVLFVCLVSFFGTSFSIMTFNNDVDVVTLFQQVYKQLTGMESSGFTVLEIGYSIGIGTGVLFFFNHFGRMKITDDPTPMQVQMRLYEDDINTTIAEELQRKEEQEC